MFVTPAAFVITLVSFDSNETGTVTEYESSVTDGVYSFFVQIEAFVS